MLVLVEKFNRFSVGKPKQNLQNFFLIDEKKKKGWKMFMETEIFSKQ